MYVYAILPMLTRVIHVYIYNVNLVDGTNTDLFINDIRSVN